MFDPAGGEAQWRPLYRLVVERDPGEAVTLHEARELLGCGEQAAWAAMRRAKRQLEDDKQQTVRTVARYGWVILAPAENLGEAEKRRRKAYRATDRAARLLAATPRDRLSQIDRARLDFESRNVLGARSLYTRRSPSLAELERESKAVREPQLPWHARDDPA